MLTRAISLLLVGASASFAAIPLTSSGLDLGYRHMYNLQFADAHQTFGDWKKAHPEDPLGPVSDGAAYLFAEFDRLHILQSELFVEDGKFLASEKQTPIPRSSARSRPNWCAANNWRRMRLRSLRAMPVLCSPKCYARACAPIIRA